MHDVAKLIEAAGFDDYDQDAATNGLCGSFALALKTVVPHGTPMLLCYTDPHGNICYDRDGSPFWRHVVISVDGHLFDVDGEVKLADLIANYCWNNPLKADGGLLKIDEMELRSLLQSESHSYDEAYIKKWEIALQQAMSRLESSGIVFNSNPTEDITLARCGR